jgi:hypothetical protein
LLYPSTSVRSFAPLDHDDDKDQNQDHYLDHDLPERNAYLEDFNDEHDQHQDEDENLHEYLVHVSSPLPAVSRELRRLTSSDEGAIVCSHEIAIHLMMFVGPASAWTVEGVGWNRRMRVQALRTSL